MKEMRSPDAASERCMASNTRAETIYDRQTHSPSFDIKSKSLRIAFHKGLDMISNFYSVKSVGLVC